MKARKIIVMFVLALLLLTPMLTTPAKPLSTVNAETRAEEYFFLRSWGGAADQIRYPRAIGVGLDNRIYSINNGRMTVINQDNRTYQVWIDHIFPSTLGAHISTDIAFDLAGNVFYPVGNSIHKYSPSGNLLLTWGELGTNLGQFKSPIGIAVDKQGRVYVADSGNYRIQVFSSYGDYIRMWELEQFSSGSIAIGNKNDIYISDLTNRCVHKYDLEGNYILTFGENIIADPYAIAINNHNQIHVVSQYLSTVEVFNSEGMFLFTIGNRNNPGDQPGEFQWLEGIAIDPKDNIYIADTFNNRIQKLTNSGDFITSWGEKVSLPGEFSRPADIIFTKQENLLVVDSANHRIQIFNKDGQFIKAWGSEGFFPGQFKNPAAAAIDENGVIYVADHDNSRIQLFSSEGNFLDIWSGGHSYLFLPVGIDINKLNGNIYVTDSGNNRIKVLNKDGQELFTWGEFGHEPGNFTGANKVVSDLEGNVYVSDGSHRIQKFDQYGNFITSWGESGDGYYFYYPTGLFIDSQNRLYVADTYNHRIQIFDLQGKFLANLGSQGYRPGEFITPSSIAIDAEGMMFISDRGNNRIQVFNTEQPAADPISGLIHNGTFSSGLNSWLFGGELPVLVTTKEYVEAVLTLGVQTNQVEQGSSQAWAHQTFYVRPEMDQPTLWFRYNMFVNDIVHYSDFFVAIQDGVGLNHLETVLRDGYPGTVAPPAGTNMGWRTARFDLSAYKGQHIRLVFSNRNLWPISWGIWTFVDDVRVVEAAELPPEHAVFLPLVKR